MTATSYLWSRRMTTTTVPFSPPKLTPLSLSSSFSSRKFSFDEIKSDCSNATTAPSSPLLFTPTEMAGILLGDSPTSAIRRCQESKEECMRIQKQFDPFLNSSSCGSINLMQYTSTIGVDRTKLSELDVEIDMASLATEVALRTLDSDDEEDSLGAIEGRVGDADTHSLPQAVRRPRMRLLPILSLPSHDSISPSDGITPKTIMSKSDGHEDLPCETPEEEELPKPVRKGRARMSQEKRRRLARRREREALLLGLPSSRPSSAPAQQTKFSHVHGNGTNSKSVEHTSQSFVLQPHPYLRELHQRRKSLSKPFSVKSYSQCLTIQSA